MPDRTQTLSVELERNDAERLLDAAAFSSGMDGYWHGRFQAAAAALEELATEFEKSAELDFLEGPMRAPQGQRGNFEGAAEAFKEAAAKVREKAAKLKEGER